jgi:hypothetical protein
LTVATGEIEQHATIETLPDEIILEIFDCVRLAARATTKSECGVCQDPNPWLSWESHRLVQVCRRWQSLIFASLQRLDLRLVYTSKRKAPGMKKALDRWPTLPIAVWYPWQCTIQSQGESFILEDENNASFALQYFSTLIAYVKSTSSSQPRCS